MDKFTRKHDDPSLPESIQSVLERTSQELLRIVDLIEESQGVVLRVIETGRITEGDMISYQKLDTATQSVCAVAKFILALKAQLQASVVVSPHEAALSLELHDVALRLSGNQSQQDAVDQDITFFR